MSYDPCASEAVRPPRGAAVAAVGALGANAVVLALFAVVSAIHVFGDDRPEVRDLSTALSFAELGLMAVTAVLVIVWLWRVRTNADGIAEFPYNWGRPWVIAGWAVPILNLWVPRSIVAGVWQVSAPAGALAWPVNVWWAAWLGYLFGSRVADLDSDGFQGAVFPFVAASGALAALFAMLVVWRITRFQEAHAVRLREAISWGTTA